MSHYDEKGIEICPDGHRCENGSMCAENPFDEGNYYCDCDEVDMTDAYSGHFCEHKATVYCTSTKEISKKSFCTNGGACKAVVGKKEVHMGCECKDGYEGAHCQFVAGTKRPNVSPVRSSSQNQNQITGGGVFLIVIVSISLFVGVIIVMRRGLKKNHIEEVEIGNENGNEFTINDEGNLTLEADGSAMKEQMATGSTLPALEEKKNDFHTIMDEEAEIL